MKNYKKLILPLLFFSFIFLPTIALAKENLIQNHEENQNEAGQVTATGARENVKEEIQEKTAAIQARLSERKQEIIRNRFNHLTRRLEAAVNRFYILINRIESRLGKIEETEEIDTEVIRMDIDTAKEELNAIGVQLENMSIGIEETLQSEDPQKRFIEVKMMVEEIKEILIEVHQKLVKIISDIKGLRVGNVSPDPVETE